MSKLQNGVNLQNLILKLKLIGIYVKKKILLILSVVLNYPNQDLLYIVAKVQD